MIVALFFGGFLMATFGAMMSYSDRIKAAPWYFPVGIALGIVANYLWLYIAKMPADKATVFMRALIWDSTTVLCYIAVPMIFYGVRVTGLTAVGAALIVIGMILTKVPQ